MGHYRLNEAIELAKGEYISILSSDDWYLPEKIKKQVDRFNELDESYGVVYSAGYRFYEDTGEMLEPATNKIMKRGNILKNLLTEPFFIYPISPLFKKECFHKYAFSKEYKAEGEALYYKIAIDYKFDFVDEPLVVMRDHSKNTGKEVYVMHNDNIKYLKELLLLKNFPEPMKKYVYKKIGHTYFYNGWHMLRRNNDKSGWLNMKKALEYNKGFLLNPRLYIALFSRFGF